MVTGQIWNTSAYIEIESGLEKNIYSTYGVHFVCRLKLLVSINAGMPIRLLLSLRRQPFHHLIHVCALQRRDW